MGLAVPLALVFLWVCLFHFSYHQENRHSSFGKAVVTIMMVSKPERIYVLLI